LSLVAVAVLIYLVAVLEVLSIATAVLHLAVQLQSLSAVVVLEVEVMAAQMRQVVTHSSDYCKLSVVVEVSMVL
jgi:hypothetical protein